MAVRKFRPMRTPTRRTAKMGPKKVLARAKGKPLSSLTKRQLKAVSNRNPSSQRVRNARKMIAKRRSPAIRRAGGTIRR